MHPCSLYNLLFNNDIYIHHIKLINWYLHAHIKLQPKIYNFSPLTPHLTTIYALLPHYYHYHISPQINRFSINKQWNWHSFICSTKFYIVFQKKFPHFIFSLHNSPCMHPPFFSHHRASLFFLTFFSPLMLILLGPLPREWGNWEMAVIHKLYRYFGIQHYKLYIIKCNKIYYKLYNPYF